MAHPRHRPNMPLNLSSTLSVAIAPLFFSFFFFLLDFYAPLSMNIFRVICYLVSYRRHDLVRSFATLTELLQQWLQLPMLLL